MHQSTKPTDLIHVPPDQNQSKTNAVKTFAFDNKAGDGAVAYRGRPVTSFDSMSLTPSSHGSSAPLRSDPGPMSRLLYRSVVVHPQLHPSCTKLCQRPGHDQHIPTDFNGSNVSSYVFLLVAGVIKLQNLRRAEEE